MTTLEILFIAFGLSMDAFAVAIGVGASGRAQTRRDFFRLSFHFGLFQFLMPIIGWGLGFWIQPLIAAFDHWIAFGLLAFIGGRMIRSGVESGRRQHRTPRSIPDSASRNNPTKGFTLVLLSLATSVDALAVGLSLAMLRIAIWYPCIIIGLVTGLITLAGMKAGGRLNETFGDRIEIAGGIILILIGLNILSTHIFS